MQGTAAGKARGWHSDQVGQGRIVLGWGSRKAGKNRQGILQIGLGEPEGIQALRGRWEGRHVGMMRRAMRQCPSLIERGYLSLSERRADRAIGRIEPEWIMDLKTKHSQLFRGIAPYIFIDAEGWKGIVAALSVNLDALGMADLVAVSSLGEAAPSLLSLQSIGSFRNPHCSNIVRWVAILRACLRHTARLWADQPNNIFNYD